ncbi:MAG: DUF433 domain-containing protein [Anaerolineales bacterium]|nr:DUF433 domain-containing protein [Anaerolineales bacterium]
MNIWDHISIDPNVCHGKPCIKGTRVMVSVILGALAGGASFNEILEEYPPITEDHIGAVMAYAGLLADEQYEALEMAFA